jgi:hypothetical protein
MSCSEVCYPDLVAVVLGHEMFAAGSEIISLFHGRQTDIEKDTGIKYCLKLRIIRGRNIQTKNKKEGRK